MARRPVLIGAAILAVLFLVTPLLANTPITHPPYELRQAYPVAPCPLLEFAGFSGVSPADECAMPGFFDIVRGDPAWSDFISAAQQQVPYVIKNVSLTKTAPETVQCASMFLPHTVVQAGTPNIRLRWPLMYEVPGTTWTLSILYGTSSPVNLPGEPMGTASYVHQDIWQWVLTVNIEDIKTLLVLFRELPFGKDEVPLISDEALYLELQDDLDQISAALASGDTAEFANLIMDFELEVMDACITVSPGEPNAAGPGTGIANTDENPACCKLLVDAEYILFGNIPAQQLSLDNLATNPGVLTPDNSQMIPVTVSYEINGIGKCSGRIVSVKANEPIKEPDWRGLNGDYRLIDAHKVYLKAAHTGKLRDRIYTITVAATNSNGDTVTKGVNVKVPR